MSPGLSFSLSVLLKRFLGESKMNERNAWDKRPEETPKQFRAFLCYLNQKPGHRTYKDAYIDYKGLPKTSKGISPHTSFKLWYDRNEWKERAQAFDDFQLQEEVERTKSLRDSGLVKSWGLLHLILDEIETDLDRATFSEKIKAGQFIRECIKDFRSPDLMVERGAILFDLGVEMDGGDV